MSLTICDKIVLHLSPYSKFRDSYQCPLGATQNGISDAVEISRAHVAIEIKRLKSNAELEEKTAHVPEAKAKRKVYFLTLKGEEKVRKMRSFAGERKVWIIEEARKKRLAPGNEAIELLKKMGLKESKAVEFVLIQDEIELSSLVIPGEEKVHRIRAPALFFGRSEELKRLGSWLYDGARFFVVVGMTGLGKTTLAEKFVSSLRMPVFWHKVYEMDNSTSFIRALGSFLGALGKKRLATYLNSAVVPDLKTIAGILKSDLQDCLAVVEDVHKSKDIESFLAFMKENGCPAKVLVTSDRKGRFYNRSDVVVNKSVEELILGGLDEGAARELLSSKNINLDPASFKKLYGMTKGHPMALALMASKEYSSSYIDFMRYLNEEILADLRPEDEQLLRKLCVLRGDIPRDVVKDSEAMALHRLVHRSLIIEKGDELVIHELVRDHFYKHLDRDNRKELHSSMADYYLGKEDNFGRLYHLVKAGRDLDATQLALKEKALFMLRLEEFADLIKDVQGSGKYGPDFKLLKNNVMKKARREGGAVIVPRKAVIKPARTRR